MATIAAAWAAINGWWFAADASKRYRAEAAWFLFAAILIIVAIRAIVRRDHESEPSPARARVLTVSLPAFVMLAIALFYPMLSIGLLSDDFVLLARSRVGALVDPTWEFLRPLPIGIWRIVDSIAFIDVPSMLHGINIGLHGANAWLTSRLAARFGFPQQLALLAGVLFLVNPASVEAVAFTADIFDLLSTALLLTACVVLTSAMSVGAITIAVAALTVAGLMTKETAAMLPVLLTMAAVTSRVPLRRVAWPIAVSAGLIAIHFPIRIALGFSAAPRAAELSGYFFKEFVSRPFGTLGLPFHVEFLTSHPWITFVFALLWPALVAWSATRWNREDAVRSIACCVWILASVLPLATMLFIADDLQGSRYVYLGSAAFAILSAGLLISLKPAPRLIIIAPVIAIFIVATISHQAAWSEAGRERDRVLAAYRESGLTCSPVGARGVTDHVRGAYVFRNGFVEAVTEIRPPAEWSKDCVLVFDGTRFTRD